MRTKILIILFSLLSVPALADGFRQVTDRTSFVKLIEGRNLTRFGVRLTVTPDGAIDGRAFGRNVDGDWAWRDGYFCRRIVAGPMTLPMNCQAVLRSGSTLRFVSDRGAGDSADLRLD